MLKGIFGKALALPARPASFIARFPTSVVRPKALPLSRYTATLQSQPLLRPLQPSSTSCLNRSFTSLPRLLQKRRHTRFDPSEVHRAKPLVSPEALARLQPRIVIIVVLCTTGGIIFYVSNLETVPISGRRRFNCFSEEMVAEEGKEAYRQMLQRYGAAILPDYDKRTLQVQRVMSRLIPASGMSDVQWRVHVINSEEKNAFVIPGGYVFVHSGILDVTQNDDGLAAVLGHEIAHNLAKHPAEKMSSSILLMIPRLLFLFLDHAGFTGGFGQLLGNVALDLGIMMRSSRQQEAEADHIGLMIMAKSCYDPAAAVDFWHRMEEADKNMGRSVPQWLSTHPANASRIAQISALVPEAEGEKAKSGCVGTMGFADGFYDAWQDFGLGSKNGCS